MAPTLKEPAVYEGRYYTRHWLPLSSFPPPLSKAINNPSYKPIPATAIDHTERLTRYTLTCKRLNQGIHKQGPAPGQSMQIIDPICFSYPHIHTTSQVCLSPQTCLTQFNTTHPWSAKKIQHTPNRLEKPLGILLPLSPSNFTAVSSVPNFKPMTPPFSLILWVSVLHWISWCLNLSFP